MLAAEEFALGDCDPVLHHHGPVALPGDPTGIVEPHDVLAAEEFALPAPRFSDFTSVPAAASRGRRGIAVAAGAVAAAVLLRRRRS